MGIQFNCIKFYIILTIIRIFIKKDKNNLLKNLILIGKYKIRMPCYSQDLLVSTAFSSTFRKKVAAFEAEPQGFLFIELVYETLVLHSKLILTKTLG